MVRSYKSFKLLLNALRNWLKEKDDKYPSLYLRLELGLCNGRHRFSIFKNLKFVGSTWGWPSGWWIRPRNWFRGLVAQLGHLPWCEYFANI